MTDEFAINILEQYREKPTLINEIATVEEAVWLDEALDMAIKALGQEPKTEWIPISSGRLPEGADYCLCCDKDGHMSIGRMSNWSSYWCFDDVGTDIDVIAWMPLPEPYKAEVGGQE